METKITTTQQAATTSKYGNLNARNILIRHKLTEKKRFDSADYQLQQYERQQHHTIPQENKPAAFNAPPVSPSSPPAPPLSPGNIGKSVFFQGITAGEKKPTTSTPTPKYGKLGVANILIRRNLRDKQRFDSADYSMEHHQSKPKPKEADHHQCSLKLSATDTTISSNTSSSIKLSPDAASHITATKKAAQIPSRFDSGDFFLAHPPTSSPVPKKTDTTGKYGQLAARNILLRKKLAERKRFDSADYYKK